MQTKITGLDTAELQGLMKTLGLPAFRGKQLAEWVYKHGKMSFDEMHNLPVDLRNKLSERYTVSGARIITIQKSPDGTAKLLLELEDGNRIETVALPYEDRFSICVSTQVGCPIGCLFCASGSEGFARNITAGEIIDQVIAVRSLIDSGEIPTTDLNKRIDHIVFMGMGEPLLNYDATLKAIRLLNTEMGIGMRNMTVSTVGVIPGIYLLAKETLQITLAVSLHAPNDILRNQLVPGARRWNISELMIACRAYIGTTGRRVTFEYCLLHGINDSAQHAEELSHLLKGINCHVNLIRFNQVSSSPYQPSSGENVKAFRVILERSSIQVTQRLERGTGIDAACGQLRRNMGPY